MSWQKKKTQKIQPNWICKECAEEHKLKGRADIETFHIGHCDICLRDNVEVGPERYYGYPTVEVIR